MGKKRRLNERMMAGDLDARNRAPMKFEALIGKSDQRVKKVVELTLQSLGLLLV